MTFCDVADPKSRAMELVSFGMKIRRIVPANGVKHIAMQKIIQVLFNAMMSLAK